MREELTEEEQKKKSREILLVERVVFLLFSRLSFLVFVVLRAAARGLNPFESVSSVVSEVFENEEERILFFHTKLYIRSYKRSNLKQKREKR